MKNDNKATSVLILTFPGKNAFWYQRKSLKNDSANIFVTSRKFNHICRPSFYRNGFESSIPISFAWSFLASWYVDVRDKTSTFSKKIGKVLVDRKKTSIFTRTLRKKDFRMQRFWISHFFLNLISRVFTIVLMAMRVSLVFNVVGKARDPGTLSYHPAGNS